MQPAVLLDRDGVINQAIIKNGKPYPPANVAEVVIPQDVAPALTRLKGAGYCLIGITNQPDVARGQTTRATVEAINAKLLQALPLDAILVCYHDDADRCACRKPQPGLLLQAAERYRLDLTRSVMVGDRWKDIAAGQNAGCATVWIDYHYAEPPPRQAPHFIATNFRQAADWILSHMNFVKDKI